MSLKVMAQVWEHPYLTNHTDKIVALALADWCNDDGKCWPSIPKLARKCSVSERAAKEIVHLLERFGYLTIELGGGRNHPNVYHLHLNRGRPINRDLFKQESQKGASAARFNGANSEPHSLNTVHGLGRKGEPQSVNLTQKGAGESVNEVPIPIYKDEPSGTYNEPLVNSGGGVHAQAREERSLPPPPPLNQQVEKSSLKPSPESAERVALAQMCGVSLSHPSQTDIHHWAPACAAIQQHNATVEDLCAFRDWWFKTPTAQGSQRKSLYLSNVANHFGRYMEQRHHEVKHGKRISKGQAAIERVVNDPDANEMVRHNTQSGVL